VTGPRSIPPTISIDQWRKEAKASKRLKLEDLLAAQIRMARLPEPLREYRWNPERRWRFDFAFVSQRLAVEVEGGTWVGGRHTTGSGFEADCVKYAEAVVAGWRVLRFTGAMVNDGRALGYLERALTHPRNAA
jgi:very-short-patch-repair endonuclease